MGEFDLLVGLTARLASTPRLDDIVDAVVDEIVALGFGAVWIAVLDDESGKLTTRKDVIDGVASPRPYTAPILLDTQQPLGKSFRDRRIMNVADPASLHLVDHDADAVPANRLAFPRSAHVYLRGRPFACGPILGSRGQPVGALGLSSYHEDQPIPDELLSRGLLRALIDQLGIAMERAHLVARLERLDANLSRAQASIVRDARPKALGELATGVAHDLNNLCGIAMLAVDVGARSSADAFAVMPRIQRANAALRDLVGRLQRAARPPQGEIEAANLGRIIDDLAVMVRPVLHEHAIDLATELEAVPPVRCDPVLIQQVVLNLVLNARDALTEVPAERRSITIRTFSEDSSVHLIVADSGPGIAPEVLERLFQMYTTTKPDAHLGLGLATSRTALAHYGATIEARTAPTGGAVFELTLIAAPSGEPRRDEPPPRATHGPSGRGRILAIDDDPDVVYIIRAYLEPLGYEITTATSSAQALEVAAAETFDLVLCDIGMPKHSGPEVCQLMRETGYRGKFVLMTGWDSQSLSIEQRAADCEAMLNKPFLGADLIRVIDAVLGQPDG